MRGNAPRTSFDGDHCFVDVEARDADALRTYLLRHGIQGTLSFDPMGLTARLDVAGTDSEWVREAVRHWRH